jgi:capsid protein
MAILHYAMGGRVSATGPERRLLSALSRSLYENGGFVGYAVNQIALYSAPIWPQAASSDGDWNKRAEELFEEWAKTCDFCGRAEFDFWSLQTLISQAMDLDGDMGVLMTSEAGFPQIQLIEGWRISADDIENSNDGVLLDSKGRVTGYGVRDGEEVTRVPSAQMLLVRDPSVVCPFRGLSALRRGMNDMRDARDILGFEKLAVKHNASLLGVLKGNFVDETQGFDLTGPDEDGEDAAAEGAPPADATPGEKTLSRKDMLGGDIPILEPGQEFQRVEGNRPNAQFDGFLSLLIGSFAAGLDIPPAFFLDQKLTGPNQRAVLGKAQRKFDQRQAALETFVGWVWVRFVAWAIETRKLQPVDGWQKVTFQRPAKLSIDAGREAMQDREDAASGLMTRQEHFGNRAKDWIRETDQAFAEHDMILTKATELAKRHGVDVSVILGRFGYQVAPTPQPATDPGHEDQSTEDEEDTKP